MLLFEAFFSPRLRPSCSSRRLGVAWDFLRKQRDTSFVELVKTHIRVRSLPEAAAGVAVSKRKQFALLCSSFQFQVGPDGGSLTQCSIAW